MSMILSPAEVEGMCWDNDPDNVKEAADAYGAAIQAYSAHLDWCKPCLKDNKCSEAVGLLKAAELARVALNRARGVA